MTKSVALYFKNENDAESARTKLQSLKVSNLYVDQMSENMRTEMYIPFFPTNVGSSQTTANVGLFGENVPLSDEAENNHNETDDEITHLLQFEVEEEDYQEVKLALKGIDCYYRN